jgi:type IV pilus assembly protein PilN
MAEINLLPWRENQREERKREFLVALVGVIIIAAGLVFLADRYSRNAIAGQQARNDLVMREIAVMDARLAQISELQQQRDAIQERMEVIQDLQGSRPIIVYVFDELVRALPQGVYFESLRRTDDTLRIEGFAENNNRVSELMRRLDESAWFDEPALQRISAARADWAEGGRANAFLLDLGVRALATGQGD